MKTGHTALSENSPGRGGPETPSRNPSEFSDRAYRRLR